MGAADTTALDDSFCKVPLELCMKTRWSLWCYYVGILLAMVAIVLLVNSVALHNKVRSTKPLTAAVYTTTYQKVSYLLYLWCLIFYACCASCQHAVEATGFSSFLGTSEGGSTTY